MKIPSVKRRTDRHSTCRHSTSCCRPHSATMRVILQTVVVLCALSLGLTEASAQQEESASSDTAAEGSFIGAAETIYPDWFKTSFLELEEDVAEASEAGKRLMIIFHQDNCPYCNIFAERNLAQKDIVETLQNKFDVIEMNMWGDREVASVDGTIFTEKTFAEALKVQFTPTVLFLTESGTQALRINGYYDPDQFRVALEYVTGKMESEMSFSEFTQQHEGESSSGELLPRTYFTGNANEIAQRPGNGSKPLLLFFEQKSCRNCETLHDEVLEDTASQELLANFDVYQIDMWGSDPITTPDGQATTGRQWSTELDISYAPTLILYAPENEEVIRSESWFKTFHTQSILDYVVSDSWREQPNFQRYLSERSDTIRQTGKDVNIWTNEDAVQINTQ